MEKIRVAIAGVGNCASSLIQGVTYYRDAKQGDNVPGLMHVELGGYHVSDLEFVAAFDVDASKVGSDLGKAIEGGMNNTIKFADVPSLGVTVQRGPTMDGLNKYYRAVIEESPYEPVDVAQVLRDTKAQVFVSYLPVGSENAQKYYAQAALDAGVFEIHKRADGRALRHGEQFGDGHRDGVHNHMAADARAEGAEAAAKMITPRTHIRRWPKMSDNRPPSAKSAARERR